MLSKIACAMLAFTSLNAFAASSWKAPAKCFAGQVKTVPFGKVEIEKTSYCTNESGSELLSKSCLENADCMALRSKGSLSKSEIDKSPVGTPGFSLCTQLKADGQIIEFTLPDGKWVKLDRCFFIDGSFIDVGSLMEITYK